MTEEEFDIFINEDLPQQLFHVIKSDVDDKTGANLEELRLVQMIASNPECLAHKPLRWFIEYFL